VDATVHDSPFVQIWARTHPDLSARIKPLLAPVTKEYYGFAVRKGDPDFLNWLNLFITQVKNRRHHGFAGVHRYFVEMQWAGVKTDPGGAHHQGAVVAEQVRRQKAGDARAKTCRGET
jgi:hypothetical protein